MKLFFSTLFLFFSFVIAAQIVNETIATSELEKRGITETEFRKKMKEKGYDLNNLDQSELTSLAPIIESAIAEIKQDQERADKNSEKIDIGFKEKVNKEEGEIKEEIPDTLETLDYANKEVEEVEELSDGEILSNEIFGYKILNSFLNKKAITNQSQVSDNYLLGPGDNLIIQIWGRSQEIATFVLDDRGEIYPSAMTKINLNGLTVRKAREFTRKRYHQYYNFRDEEFSFRVDGARKITVNILGEVNAPGMYKISANNSAFNALALANGITEIGSFRNAKLIHADGTSVNMDLYTLLLNPEKIKDFYLKGNDYIFIPAIEGRVTISGAINRPFSYELKEREGLKELIHYAGGFKENALNGHIQITRFENDKQKIIDLDYNEILKKSGNFELKYGDLIKVGSISKPFQNFVEIKGAVHFEGNYEYNKNLKVSNLIEKGVLANDAKKDIAYLFRKNDNSTYKYIRVDLESILENPNGEANFSLKAEDVLMIFSNEDFVDKGIITIDGAVRKPGHFPYTANDELKISDLLNLGGGVLPDAADFAFIHRADPYSKKLKEYLKIDLRNIEESSDGVIALRPNDSIYVYFYEDFVDKSKVLVHGAVRLPGPLSYDKSLTLSNAITLAGGLKLEASRSRIDISRLAFSEDNNTKTIVISVSVDENLLVNGEEFILEPYDEVMVRNAPEFEFQERIELVGEVKFPGTYSLIDDNENILSVINRAGGVTNEGFPAGATLYRKLGNVGYIVLDFEEVLNNPKSRFNYILKKGDVLEIPKRKDFVAIKGETRANELYPDKILQGGKINVPFSKNKNARWYVNNYAAGFGDDARRRLVTVEYPNGEIKRTKFFGLFYVYPKVKNGSTVSVGRKDEEILREKVTKEEVDWNKVIANTMAQVTAVLSLIVLADRLK